jgi:hypothetical protein
MDMTRISKWLISKQFSIVSRIVCAGLTCALSFICFAQQPSCDNFVIASEYSTGPGPKGIAVADFDNDGLKDIVTAFSGSTNGFSVIRNLGQRRFAPKVDFIIPPNIAVVEAVFVDDLDRDGLNDLLVSDTFGRRISVFRNISSGAGDLRFAPRSEITSAGEQARFIAFGDFDLDGLDDVAVANRTSPSAVSIFRNVSIGNGSITFESRIDFATPAGELSTGDFDNDGKTDIAVGNSQDLRILRNTSSGIGVVSFATSSAFSVGNAVMGITSVDIDSDGRMDVAVTVQNNDRVSLFRNLTNGPGNISFATKQDLTTGPAPFGLISADIDGDGLKDLASANNNSNSVTVLRNVTSMPGLAQFATRRLDYGVGFHPYDLAVEDMDGDGKLDLVTANVGSDNVSVLYNGSVSGNVDFLSRKDYIAPPTASFTDIKEADFDLDGNIDLVAVFRSGNGSYGLSVYRNDGSGRFETSLTLPVAGPVLAVADFDGDHKPDLALEGQSAIGVYKNTSSGPGVFTFQFNNIGFSCPIAGHVTSGDFDGDGKPDLVFTYSQSITDTVRSGAVLKNLSSSSSVSFTQAFTFTMLGNNELVTSDFNKDGLLDFGYITQTAGNPFVIQKNITNNGGIGFASQEITIPNGLLGPTIAGDLDGDGWDDLITSSENSSLSLLLSTSSFDQISFSPRIMIPDQAKTVVGLADIDNDGRSDLVTTNTFGGFVSLYINRSIPHSVSLDAPRQYAYGGTPNIGSSIGVGISDLNNDRLPDVAVGFHGASTGTLSILLASPCQTHRNVAFDFDGDGKTDISIFRPSVGEWWYSRSSDNVVRAGQFGTSTDIITPGDFTGDGKADWAFFSPSTGFWFILRSEDGSFFSFPFGSNGDIPMPADFDGDGKTDAAVFRPSSGTWFILQSGGGGTAISPFGSNGDKPVAFDYDGDGKADIGIVRDNLTSGNKEWWIQRSNLGILILNFGIPGDKTVPGDYTGDGKADVAFFRPSSGFWYILRSEDFSYLSFGWGQAGDIPAPGDYDGDGKTDAAVFRPSSSTWFVNRTGGQGPLITGFGVGTDTPVPSSWVR